MNAPLHEEATIILGINEEAKEQQLQQLQHQSQTRVEKVNMELENDSKNQDLEKVPFSIQGVKEEEDTRKEDSEREKESSGREESKTETTPAEEEKEKEGDCEPLAKESTNAELLDDKPGREDFKKRKETPQQESAKNEGRPKHEKKSKKKNSLKDVQKAIESLPKKLNIRTKKRRRKEK